MELSLSNYVNLFCEGWKAKGKKKNPFWYENDFDCWAAYADGCDAELLIQGEWF